MRIIRIDYIEYTWDSIRERECEAPTSDTPHTPINELV